MANNLTFKRQFASIHHVVPAVHFGDHVIIAEHDGNQFITGPAITKLAAYEALGMEPHEMEVMIQEVKAAHATKLLECEICGTKFEPTKERHYVVDKGRGPLFTGVLVSLADAFDCPKCGCQVDAGIRYNHFGSLGDLDCECEVREKEEE